MPQNQCKEDQKSKVLFFPDPALPCRSFQDTLMSGRNAKCKYKSACKFQHRGDKSSLIDLYLELDRATGSIDICVYLITVEGLSDFLIHLQETRGIRVRLITHTDSAGDEEYKLKNQASDLQKAGIDVRINQNGSALMHNKFVIIDNKRVVLGSFNWTRNAILRNDEAVIVTSQADIVLPVVKKFKSLWKQMQIIT